MGVDLSKQRKEQTEEERRNQRFTKARTWKPKAGKNVIRLMPPWTDEGPNADTFFREIATHWNVGENKTFTCAKRTPGLNGNCPICDQVDALRATKDPEDLEMAQSLSARRGFISNIVDLSDPVFTEEDVEEAEQQGTEVDFQVGDTKVQVYSYGVTVKKQLVDFFVDLDIDLTEFKTGRNVIVKRSGQGKNDTKYNLMLATEASLFKFKGDLDKSLYNLDGLYPPRDENDVRTALAEVVGSAAALGAPAPRPSLPKGRASVEDEDEEEDDVAHSVASDEDDDLEEIVTRSKAPKASNRPTRKHSSMDAAADDLEDELRGFLSSNK